MNRSILCLLLALAIALPLTAAETPSVDTPCQPTAALFAAPDQSLQTTVDTPRDNALKQIVIRPPGCVPQLDCSEWHGAASCGGYYWDCATECCKPNNPPAGYYCPDLCI